MLRWLRTSSTADAGRRVPASLTAAWTALVGVLVPVYWHHYGPLNFLWGSDVALVLVLASLWSGRALPNSMAAIGVLPFEVLWIADFASGASLLGATGYMFEAGRPGYLRALSLFHLLLPVVVVFLLWRLGYDRRALPAQAALGAAVLLATYLLTDPAANINFAFGPGNRPQQGMDPRLYLATMIVAVPIVVLWPMHALLGRLAPPPRDVRRGGSRAW